MANTVKMLPRAFAPTLEATITVEIRHLRYFVMVADKLHFTRAAEELYVAQPALSHQIKRLEASLHLQLLERSTRAVTLTEAGQGFLAAARQAVAAYDAAISTADRLRAGGDVRLRLGTNPRFTHALVGPITDAIVSSGPHVAVDIVGEATAMLLADLSEGRLDLVFCLAPWAIPGLVSEVIAEDTLRVVLPDGHELAGQREVTIADLADEVWMLPSDRKAKAFNERVHSWASAEGVQFRQSPVHPDYDNTFSLVAEGAGIEIVPTSFVGDRELHGVTVVPLASDYRQPLALVWQEGNADPTLARAIDAVRGVRLNPPSSAGFPLTIHQDSH
jgi:DNA-binding transcriptional LysR family regulator